MNIILYYKYLDAIRKSIIPTWMAKGVVPAHIHTYKQLLNYNLNGVVCYSRKEEDDNDDEGYVDMEKALQYRIFMCLNFVCSSIYQGPGCGVFFRFLLPFTFIFFLLGFYLAMDVTFNYVRF